MVTQILAAMFDTQTILWFPLHKSIGKVCRFDRPTNWWCLNSCLATQHLLSNLLPTSASIRSLSNHQLIENNAQREEVALVRVVAMRNDLWCHIARRAASVIPVSTNNLT